MKQFNIPYTSEIQVAFGTAGRGTSSRLGGASLCTASTDSTPRNFKAATRSANFISCIYDPRPPALDDLFVINKWKFNEPNHAKPPPSENHLNGWNMLKRASGRSYSLSYGTCGAPYLISINIIYNISLGTCTWIWEMDGDGAAKRCVARIQSSLQPRVAVKKYKER